MSNKLDNYTISINGDDKNLQLAVRNSVGGLNKVGRAANDADGGTKALSGSFRDAATHAAAFEGPLGGISGRLGAMSTLLGNVNPLMIGLGLAVSGVSVFMASAVKEHDQLALRNKKQEALLKSTGYAAGFAAHELDAMAKSVALNTLASVEGIKDTQNVLLTFKGVSESSFRSAITLSQDMAAVMGTDSKAAALQLGKALESPTEGISALKRAGVSFSQAEKEMIRDMENAGRVADAQTYILETLKNQIGGAGEAEAGTLAGAVDTLSQNWQTLKTVVAEDSGAAAGMKNLATGMANIIDRINHSLAPDDDSRLAQLWVESQTLQKSLDDLWSGEDRSFLSYIVGKDSESLRLNSEISLIDKEIAEIEARQASRKAEEEKADAAAVANENAKTEELLQQKKLAEDKKTAVTQAKYASDLLSMDMQFATETEKAELQNQKYLTRIDEWQLSEQEVKSRGFETMAELQESYRALADEKLDSDLLKIKLKIDKAEEEKTKKAKDEAEKRAKNEAAAQKQALQAVLTTSGQFLNLLESNGQKQSAVFKTIFLAQQAAQVAMTIANAEAAATATVSHDAPIMGIASLTTGNIIRASGYASAGIIAGQAIAGAFENGGIVGGSSYTGDNLTAFVNSSEMILNRPQQKQLFDMANGVGAGGGSSPIINIIEDASKAGQTEQSKGPTGEDIINVWVASINNGGEAASTIEQRYGLERIGR